MLLLIDNYDSFTYNLVQYIRELETEVIVHQNDAISIEEVIQAQPTHILISPGPGGPESAGITVSLIQQLAGVIPILGVCLGHQAIGAAFGARIISAPKIMHGKTSSVDHHQQGLFSGLQKPLAAMRYHSLVIDPDTLSEDFRVTAWTQDDAHSSNTIMAIEHQTYPLSGVQFHPESIGSEAGHHLLRNFLEQ